MNRKAITAERKSAVINHDAELASICKYSSTDFNGVLLCEEIWGIVC